MLVRPNTRWAVLTFAVMVGTLTTGCATKKFVQKLTDPLTQRLGKNEAKTADNSQQIRDLDQRTEEGISAAQAKADEASAQAAQAGKQAQDAQLLGQQGIARAGAVDQKLESADKFQTVKTATILFAINKSELSDDSAQQLDEIAESIKAMKHYVIEVQGFTDATGPKTYNLQLSHRRADAVVRYLTSKHNIPLVKIQLLGYGEDSPAASNDTREGRKENRRVELKVLAPEWAAGQVQAQSNSTTSSQ
jgi:OmpA-OmpF porin, OOP family